MKRFALVVFTFSLLGCSEAQMHGVGHIYIFNAGPEPLTYSLDGQSADEGTLAAERGKLISPAVAGEYRFTAGGVAGQSIELIKDHLVLFNPTGGCFARSDISGRYSGKKPIKVLEVYRREVIDIPDTIDVLPGKRMPATRKKSPYAFQRVSVIPCAISTNDHEVTKFVRQQK